MDKKYLVIIRIHDPEVIKLYPDWNEQQRKWKVEISRFLSSSNETMYLTPLPDGIDIEIKPIK